MAAEMKTAGAFECSLGRIIRCPAPATALCAPSDASRQAGGHIVCTRLRHSISTLIQSLRVCCVDQREKWKKKSGCRICIMTRRSTFARGAERGKEERKKEKSWIHSHEIIGIFFPFSSSKKKKKCASSLVLRALLWLHYNWLFYKKKCGTFSSFQSLRATSSSSAAAAVNVAYGSSYKANLMKPD